MEQRKGARVLRTPSWTKTSGERKCGNRGGATPSKGGILVGYLSSNMGGGGGVVGGGAQI